MMPNRFIKESITTSETLAQLSAEAERFWHRLIVVVDDYGRMDARPAILRAKCFAAMLDKVKDGHVARWANELRQVGLILTYQHDGGVFLVVAKWAKYQTIRAKTSKYPIPPLADANICEQMQANASVFVFGSGSEERDPRSGSVTRTERARTPFPEDFVLTPELTEFAQAGGLNPKLEFAHFRDHHIAKGTLFKSWGMAFRTWCRRADQFRRRA